jgi:hypothetical protein
MLRDCGFIGSFGKRRKLSHSNLAATSTQTGALLPPSNVSVIKATSGSIGQPGPSATQPVASPVAIPGQSTMSPQAALTTSTQMSTNPSAATYRPPQQSPLSTTAPSFCASVRTAIASSVAGSANVLVPPRGTNFTAPLPGPARITSVPVAASAPTVTATPPRAVLATADAPSATVADPVARPAPVRPPLQLMRDRNPVCATLYRIWESQGDVDADLKEQLNGVTAGNRCELVPTQRCLQLLVISHELRDDVTEFHRPVTAQDLLPSQ